MSEAVANGSSTVECLNQNELFIQQLIHVLSLALKIDVAVIDSSLRLFAGTGPYQSKKHVKYEENCASYLVIKNGEPVIIRNPKDSSVCKKCPRYETCSELGSISYPIIADRIIGNIALVATTSRQWKNMLSNENDLLYILNRISYFIANSLYFVRTNKQITGLMKQLDTINNSIKEGVLYFDRKGRATYNNHAASLLLNMRSQEIIGKSLDQLFKEGDKLLPKCYYYGEKLLTLKSDPSIKFFGTSVTLDHDENEYCPHLILTIQERCQSESNMNQKSDISFENIIGISDAIISIKNKARQVAQSDSTVLITGESGTGKELLAKAIHNASHRNKGPFISFNCGAIPTGILESELFGYEEGAFTGARKGGKPGKFELANNGTIFLDEIGDMPIIQQAKILRVLEEQQVDRLGGSYPRRINVRIITATNKDLEGLVNKGQFREDLYYRLKIIPLHMPPLRERREDIEVYVQYFLKEFNNLLKKNVCSLTPAAMRCLTDYSWPGNVRELRNTIEYAVNIALGPYIDLCDLPEQIIREGKETKSIKRIEEAEFILIRKALLQFGSDTEGKKKAAQYLGISLSTLYRKLRYMKQYSETNDFRIM